MDVAQFARSQQPLNNEDFTVQIGVPEIKIIIIIITPVRSERGKHDTSPCMRRSVSDVSYFMCMSTDLHAWRSVLIHTK